MKAFAILHHVVHVKGSQSVPRFARGPLGVAISLCCVTLVSAAILDAGPLVLVTKDASGTFGFIEAEQIEINRKESGRSLGTGTTLDPKQWGKLSVINWTSATPARVLPDGALYILAGDDWHALAPEGHQAKQPEGVAPVWQRASIAYKRTRADKQWTTLDKGSLIAIAAGAEPSAAALDFAQNPAHFRWQGRSEDAAIEEMRAFLAAAVKRYSGTKPVENYRKSLLASIATAIGAWDEGGRAESVLDRALAMVATASAAFPDDAGHARARKGVLASSDLLHRRIAILTALRNGEQWDAFLAKYLEFEPHQLASKSLTEARTTAYRQSVLLHSGEGKDSLARNDLAGALRGFRIALQRNPADEGTEHLFDEARLKAARVAALQLASGRRMTDPTDPRQVQIRRHLELSRRYIADNKLDEAAKEFRSAGEIDKDHPGVLLGEARLAAAKGELSRALTILNRYDSVAGSNEEFAAGDQFRTELVYQLRQKKSTLKSEIESAFQQNWFSRAFNVAVGALSMDGGDQDFLYYAGVNAAILRRPEEARELLRRYLLASDSLAGDGTRRDRTARILRSMNRESAPLFGPAGRRSWFSGRGVEAATYYDPASLAFLPRVNSVQGSKLTVNYTWKDDRLLTVHSKYENKHTGANVFSMVMAGAAGYAGTAATLTTQAADSDTNDFYFTYYDDSPQVLQVTRERAEVVGGRSVSYIGAPTTLATGVVQAGDVQAVREDDRQWRDSTKGFITLVNNPRVDPKVAQTASGKPVARGFAGNSRFHPFAWDGIHTFVLFYDNAGRIASAQEEGDGKPFTRFEWDGDRLVRIVQRASSHTKAEIVYSRTLHYSENRLTAETITGGSKPAKIEYKYDKSGRLVEADCSEDSTLDNRSRKVVFVAEAGAK